MLECKKCGSTEIVRSGKVREKQRYLCKKCGCHFVEGDKRETQTTTVLKSLCTVFQALGAKKYSLVGRFFRRDTSTIYRWMNKTSIKYKKQWSECVHEFWNIDSVLDEMKLGGVDKGDPLLFVDNLIDDLYVAVIVQQRKK